MKQKKLEYFKGVKEKILDGFEFKKHIDTAAELNPSDHITHHLLGRFCFEVSQVSVLYFTLYFLKDLFVFLLRNTSGNGTLKLGAVGSFILLC